MATRCRSLLSQLTRIATVALVLTVAAPHGARAALLEFVESQVQGMNGVSGLNGVLAVVVSQDGRDVYAAAANNDAIAAFRRDPATGALTQTQIVKDGVDGVDGLAFASALALSPDGNHLYVTGSIDNAIVTFSRNKRTGTLTFSDVLVQGLEGVEGMTGALWVAASPDGTKLFVASTHDNAVVAFSRDQKSGALHYVEMQQGGPTSLAFARGVVVSPDGKNVYVAGASSNALNVFRLNE